VQFLEGKTNGPFAVFERSFRSAWISAVMTGRISCNGGACQFMRVLSGPIWAEAFGL
jgi:hypothetical protein